ncbi:TnsA endonuclease N-terminal domain-containing protein [Sphingomonas corticis]|nr:TnsA endonuclease N-terminal domain-containing protein [Sphingomonas corticis]
MPDDACLDELAFGIRYDPVRDPRTRRNARSITGELVSIRDSVCHVFESLGEMRTAIILDVDFDVVAYRTQPERMRLDDGGTYTPDVQIRWRDGRVTYREVKPDGKLAEKPDLDGRVDPIRRACAERGADFEIVTDRWYGDPVRLRNANLLRHAFRRSRVDDVAVVVDLLGRRGTLPLSEISRESGLGPAGHYAALALAAARRCRVDLDIAIGFDTMLRLA